MQANIDQCNGFRQAIEACPDRFDLEVTSEPIVGFVCIADVVTVQKSAVSRVEAGDGIVIGTPEGRVLLRRYRPLEGGGFVAEGAADTVPVIDSNEEAIDILAVVVGIPETRWSATAAATAG